MKNQILHILLLIINIIIILEFDMTEYAQSILMCSNFLYILLNVWVRYKLTPFFLFLITFCFLFIGGHFWGNLFSPDLLSTRVGSFMDPIPSSETEWRKTLLYILIFLYCSLLGYEKKYEKKNMLKDNTYYFKKVSSGNNVSFNRFLSIVFIPLSIIVIYTQYQALLQVLTGGYSVVYLSQNDNYSSNSSLVVFSYFFFAMAMVYGNKKNRRLYLGLLCLDGLIKILAGGRGSFGSFLMLIIWLCSLKWNINLKKIFILGIGGLVILLSMSQLSKRAQDSNNKFNKINDIFGLFVYAQGESLSTFESSRNFTYPVIAYVQTFIPGSGYLHAKLIDTDAKNYESSFSLYLSRSLNWKKFERGDGAGWTVLSDIYVFSGRTWIGFILLSLLLGCCFAVVEIKSKRSTLWRVVLFASFLRLMILPRTGLNYICPLIVYVLIYHSILNYFFKFKKT